MTPHRRALLAGLVVLLAAAVAPAQEPIRFARTPDISPDGKLVAFSYLGDVWTVEAIGGVARPVTMHEAHDVNPVFSPDGRWIAFSSNRHGQYDVFVVPAVGGRPRRLTFDSGQDMVCGWTPDGKGVVFSSTRSPAFPSNVETYVVPFEGGAERKLPLFEAKEAHFSPTGSAVAFVRGPGTWYRRGYRGSSNDDVWLASPDGSVQRRLTTFDGQDGSPMWSPDGRKLYYVTENGSTRGCANVVCQDVSGSEGKGLIRLTTHEDDTVRRARISGNGEWIVYECGGDLWVVATRGGVPPRKLAIEVHADDKSNTERSVTFARDASEFALSPDEDHAVISVQGELFLTRVPNPPGTKATRLTDSPAYDHGASFSPDGKSILFASDRTGVQELYLLEPDDPEHPELTKAHKFKTKQLTHTPEEESAATFSPKGDRIAFIRSGKLWTMKPDGTGEKAIVDQQQVREYDWSPDGAHLVVSRMDGSFASELYVVAADGSSPPRNVTRYATYNEDVVWSPSGNRIAFISQRRGAYNPYVLNLQRPAAPGTKPGPSGEIDFDDIHLRAERVAGISAETLAISPDGTQVAFRSLSSGDDLWVASSTGGSLRRVTYGSQSPRQIRWSKKSGGRVFFLNGAGELRYVYPEATYGPDPSAAASRPDPLRALFQAKMTIRRDEEFEEMFAQSWRALSDKFYDPLYHGANWQAIRDKYLPLVAHVAMKEDLYALISMMCGELNASHLGISGKLPTPDEHTAELGLVFDDTFRGPGLKVAEVLRRGPADRRGVNLKPGDVILAIDRVELTDRVNVSQLLNNKAGEGVTLDVTSDPKDPKSRRQVEIFAISRDDGIQNPRPLGSIDRRDAQELMYERWVARNAVAVEKASGGKIGYVHIPSMDEAGLETFVRSLYSDNFDKDAVIIDVRYNGGGFTHDQVLNYLGGREHTFFRQRDGGEGLVLRSYDRKWTRPLVVMCNNRSYSDAEIFPQAVKTLGLGKVVGQPTGGHVIGTTSVRLIDGSTFRVPRTGVYTVGGVNMEKQGVMPDVVVEISAEDWAKGTDTQLVKATEVATADAAAWKKTRSPGAAPLGPAPQPPRVIPPAQD
jgi:tricorn protease